MISLDSMEKQTPPPCPFLPVPQTRMSYRDLQQAAMEGSGQVFASALTYAQALWMDSKPARSILALCRAIYLDPSILPAPVEQPYRAFAWILNNYQGQGFLGNPRISFQHQGTRIPPRDALKRQRAWALWWITRTFLPQLPGDPNCQENFPQLADLAGWLDQYGLPGEGSLLENVIAEHKGS